VIKDEDACFFSFFNYEIFYFISFILVNGMLGLLITIITHNYSL